MKRTVVSLAGVLVMAVTACVSPIALASNWSGDADGPWNTAGNWTGGVPNAIGAQADLSVPTGITGTRTVWLDVNATVGNMAIDDTDGTPNSWLVAPDATPGEALTFNDSDALATLTVNQGNANRIGVPLTLTDPLRVTTAAGTSLNLSGKIAGTRLEKTGTGTLRLSADNSAWAGPLYLGVNVNYEHCGTIELTSSTSMGTGYLRVISYGSTVRFNNVSGGPLTVPNSFVHLFQSLSVQVGGGDITFTGSPGSIGYTYYPDAGTTVTLANTRTGAFGHGLDGLGILIVGGDASAYTGTWSINDGDNLSTNQRIGIAADNALGNASAKVAAVQNYAVNTGHEYFAVGGPRTLANRWGFSAYSYSNNLVTFSGSHDLTLTGDLDSWWQNTGSPRWIVTNTALTTISGRITADLSASGNLYKQGSGTLVLSGDNSVYTRPIQIDAGVLRAQDGWGLPTASRLILNGGVLEANGSFARTLGTASGNVNWLGTTGGGFAAVGGGLTVDLNSPGAGNLTWGSGGFVGGALAFGSTRADSAVTLVDNIALGASDRTIAVADNAGSPFDKAVLSGQITGAGGLIKTGAGVLELDGDNAYTGSTLVSAGTLLIHGTTNNQGSCTVTAGATLGGDGAIGLAPEVSMDVSGTVSPGANIGTLTVGTPGNANTVTFADGSVLLIEMDGLGNCDRLVVNGTLDLEAAGDTLVLTGEISKGVLYTLATADTILGQFGSVNSSALGLTVPLIYGPNSITIFIPEPATLGLAGGALAALLLRRRR